MTKYFTHYWNNETWDFNRMSTEDTFNHTAGNMFKSRGVTIGDEIYVITVKKGILYVAVKIHVDHLVGQNEAEKMLNYPNTESDKEIWQAREHVISDRDCPVNFDRSIPSSYYSNLSFVRADGIRPPKTGPDGLLDQQTLRGVSEMTPRTAKLIDSLMT